MARALSSVCPSPDSATRNGAWRLVLAEPARDVEAVHAWHAQVQHGDVRVELGDLVERRPAVCRRRHDVTFTLQQEGEHLAAVVIVVGHQNAEPPCVR